MKYLLGIVLLFYSCCARSGQNIVNIYVWEGLISEQAIQSFEKETGITVNISSYDSNETLFAKLKAMRQPVYDIVMPSSYFLDRLRRQGMLKRLDRRKLSNFKHVDPFFLNRPYDPKSEYGIPFTWGITGILVNNHYYDPRTIKRWSDLWDKKYYHQLLLLNDTREVFSMAMLALGYQANDQNPQHIHQAYQKLRQLSTNIKLFSPDNADSIYVDEDAHVGMSWNGDYYRIHPDNSALRFIFPQEGFVVWTDMLAIPKNAPHRENAYKLLNYLLRPQMSMLTTTQLGYAATNLSAKKLLPSAMQKNEILFPPAEIMAKGQFQTDISDEALALYEKYWLLLKLQS